MALSNEIPGWLRPAAEQLREWLRPRLENGVDCPVCGQTCQTYKRRVSSAMVTTMGRLLVLQNDLEAKLRAEKELSAYDAASRAWVHLADVEQPSRDVATCAYFDLMEQDEKRRGYWRITETGKAFLRGDATIPKYAHVFDGKVRGFSAGPITVRVVQPRFDLTDLTGGSE